MREIVKRAISGRAPFPLSLWELQSIHFIGSCRQNVAFRGVAGKILHSEELTGGGSLL